MGGSAMALGGPIGQQVLSDYTTGSGSFAGKMTGPEQPGAVMGQSPLDPNIPNANYATSGMPIYGGLNSALGTTSTAGATPAEQTGNYITRTSPNGSTYQVFQATDANGNPLMPTPMPSMSAPDGGATPMPIQGAVPQGGFGFANLPSQQPTTNALQSFIGNNTNPYANSSSPYFQAANAQTLGNLAGAQQATQANRVNQNTAYGGLQYQQGVDQFGNPTWTANQTTNPQTQGLINSSLGSLQASIMNPAYGINPGETATNAILRRLQPQMAQQAEQQASNLANQGIVPGTAAYDNAMRTFQQGQNDLLTSAQTAGINTGLQAQQLQNQQAANIKSLTTPNFINAPTQATVAGPDYTGALATQTNANIAAQNAALGQATNNTAGLYGLGSAGILGLAANPGLLTSAGKGISSAYDWLSNQF